MSKHIRRRAAAACALLFVSAAAVAAEAAPDDMSAAFDLIVDLVVVVGSYAFVLVFGGAQVWTAIKLFRKGVRSGGGQS